MNRTPAQQRAISILRISILVVTGIIATAYLFVMQRGPVPFRDTYDVKAVFTRSDGVIAGLGQPVNVAGVKVGSVVGTRLAATGNAIVTLQIERGELARVWRNARATLEAITPLKDMQIELDPGTSDRGPLPSGGTIPVQRTQSPAELADLLSALDGDTRSFLTSLIRSLDDGTRGRAVDTRLLLRALGPTADQARQVSLALADRRRSVARLVTNIARVTHAASANGQLSKLVPAAQRTLAAANAQDEQLRQSLDQLPPTLRATRAALRSGAAFFDDLQPAVRAVTPVAAALPEALRALTPFGRTTATALKTDIRPFVRELQPVVRDITPAIRSLSATAAPLTTVLRVTNYALNEFAYNPPGNDEGLVFWFGWAAHNFSSAFSFGDAHGSIGRSMILASCPLTNASVPGALIRLLTGSSTTCKGTE